MGEKATQEGPQIVTADGSGDSKPLTQRAKDIITNPKQEWQRVDTEPATIRGIYVSYVMILAAIGPLATVIGTLLFGYPSILGFTYRPSAGAVIGGALLSYLLTLVGVYVLALIIDALAPSFDAKKDRLKAFKLAAYASTAAWLAGVFNIIPALSFLAILGLYSLYLLYLGLPKLMRAPETKALGYTVVTVLAAIVIWIVIGLIGGAVINPLTSAFGSDPKMASSDSVSGSFEIPGGGTIDMGQLEAASKQFEAAAEQAQAGGVPTAVPPQQLASLLPQSLADYRQVELASTGASAGGIGGSQAEARYESGENRIELQVLDLGGAAGLAAMGGAFNLESNRQTETGYERTTTVDGRMTTESWDSSSKRGKFGVLVANRFMVEADGRVESIDDLKQAVTAVGFDRLERLAR